jgi:putative hydrolase of the HAD superfamily
MARLTGLPAAFFQEWHPEHRQPFDRGLIDGPAMYRGILTDAGRSDLAADDALVRRLAELELEHWRPLDDAAVEWALSLQKAGYLLGILSNMPHEFLHRYEAAIPIFAAADQAIFSCRVGLIKPEPAIYETALRALGVQPEEAVFFDDLEENIAAAQALGIHAILWTTLDSAQNSWNLLHHPGKH